MAIGGTTAALEQNDAAAWKSSWWLKAAQMGLKFDGDVHRLEGKKMG